MNATDRACSVTLPDVSSVLLALGYSVRFRANGSSMYPTIRDGELITVVPAGPSEVRKGDIVLYRSDHGVIAHRVKGSGPTRFRLRGDAADADDAPVGPQRILGKVVFVHRGCRRIRLAARWARLRQGLRADASRLKRSLCPPQRLP